MGKPVKNTDKTEEKSAVNSAEPQEQQEQQSEIKKVRPFNVMDQMVAHRLAIEGFEILGVVPSNKYADKAHFIFTFNSNSKFKKRFQEILELELKLDGFIYTITATDRTIFLDLPFDYTSCQWDAERSKDNTVPTSYVIQNIASQAGFSGFNDGDISKIIPRLPYADLATTCRSILTSLSEIACGMWYCGTGNSLQFFAFGDINNMYATSLPSSECTDLQRGLVTGPINGVLMINDSTDSGDSERFESGNILESFNKIKVVSKYATASTCSALFNRVKNAEYTAFSIQHCYCFSYIPIGMRIILDENDYECFMATNVNIYLSPTGSYASISGDADSEIEWDFSGLLTQKVNQRIAENTKYHGVSLSKKEGLICDGVAGKITMADGEINFYSSGSNTSAATEKAAAYAANTDGHTETEKKKSRTKITIREGRIIFSKCTDDEDTDSNEETVNMENGIALMTLSHENSNETEKDDVTDSNAINNENEFIKKVFPEDYSLTLDEGGILEYDGAIIDKQDFLYVEKIDDNTAIVAYPNAKYKCTRTIDGNKHYYKTERIE